MRSRGQQIDGSQSVHDKLYVALNLVQQAIPAHQRRVRIDRDDLDRFLFAPDDLVCVVGQDGLVPNVAKYLAGQTVIGINPDPEQYDGVLCAHAATAAHSLLKFACADASSGGGHYRIKERTMALARREDGQELRALNEVFIGALPATARGANRATLLFRCDRCHGHWRNRLDALDLRRARDHH